MMSIKKVITNFMRIFGAMLIIVGISSIIGTMIADYFKINASGTISIVLGIIVFIISAFVGAMVEKMMGDAAYSME